MYLQELDIFHLTRAACPPTSGNWRDERQYDDVWGTRETAEVARQPWEETVAFLNAPVVETVS